MSSPKCPACGHINMVGATMCDICEAPLHRPYGEHRHPYDFAGDEVAAGGLSTDVPSPEFSGIGEVFSPTLAFYRKQFPLVALLVLITTFPVVFFQYISAFQFGTNAVLVGPAEEATFQPQTIVSVIAGGLLSVILSFIGTSVLGGALVYGVIEVQRTGSAKVGECLRWGLKKLPRLLAGNILYALIIGAGFLLLIIPGVIFSLMFALVVPIIAAEGCGVIEAFKRSESQTRGYKGLLFLTYFLWSLLIFAVSFAINSSFAFGAGLWAFSGLFLQALVQQLLQTSSLVLTVFIYLGIRNLARQRDSFATPVSASYGNSTAER